MLDQPRWPKQAWIPLLTGLLWLWTGFTSSVFGLVFCFLPGIVLTSTGVSLLLYPGDKRILEVMSLAGFLLALLAVPGLFVLGVSRAAGLFLLSLASVLSAASAKVRQQERAEEIPPILPSLKLFFEAAVDNTMLGTIPLFVTIPSGDEMMRIQGECVEAKALFEERGWLEKPEAYHKTPEALTDPTIQRKTTRGWDFEHLSCESGYEPLLEEPGRNRWLSYERNRTAHAWMMRHPELDRPWLVCIHGYQMGFPFFDLSAFEAPHLHRELGLNILLPVLPLHGKRKKGWISGDGFLSGDLMDALHAEAQAMWDIRRWIQWIRSQGATKIGATGLSLGGYNTALLACLEEELACAIPGVPLADMADVLWHHGPPLQLRAIEAAGFTLSTASELLRPIAPLVLKPKVAKARRLIFGGVVDQQVPPRQIRDLWRHWDKPQILWYQGAHVSFMMHSHIREGVDEFLVNAGLVPGQEPSV